MIRLLKKEEIAQAKASERNKEIAEGLKLSKRVDNLRELQATTEANYEKFHEKALGTIMEDIRALEERKQVLISETDLIRKELLNETTLTREERKNLESLKLSLQEKQEELTQKQSDITFQEIDIAIALQDAKESEARAISHEVITRNLQASAEYDRQDAAEKRKEAILMEKQTEKFKSDTEGMLFLRENNIKVKERELETLEQSLMTDRKDVALEKIRLADQRHTLERSLERLKQKRLA